MTTITVNRLRCGHREEQRGPRVITREVRPDESPEDIARWVKATRECGHPECMAARGGAEKWGESPFSDGRYHAPAPQYGDRLTPAEVWHKHDGQRCHLVQLYDHSPNEREALAAAGFARLTAARTHLREHLRAGRETVTTMQTWADWARDTMDHTEHTCPDCKRAITESCSNPACRDAQSRYRCAECGEAARAVEQAAASEREHNVHVCGECGSPRPTPYTCTRDIDAHTASVTCLDCHQVGILYPASQETDRPLVHCNHPDGCAIIVPRPGDRCRYHAEPAPTTVTLCVNAKCENPAVAMLEGQWECAEHNADHQAGIDARMAAFDAAVARATVIEQAETVAAAAILAPANPEPESPSARTCGRVTCDTRAHTAGGWAKRGMTVQDGAQPFARDGWELYCRHQVAASVGDTAYAR